MAEESADETSVRLSRAAGICRALCHVETHRGDEGRAIVGGPTVIYIPRTMTSVVKKKKKTRERKGFIGGRAERKRRCVECLAFVLATPKTGGSFPPRGPFDETVPQGRSSNGQLRTPRPLMRLACFYRRVAEYTRA